MLTSSFTYTHNKGLVIKFRNDSLIRTKLHKGYSRSFFFQNFSFFPRANHLHYFRTTSHSHRSSFFCLPFPRFAWKAKSEKSKMLFHAAKVKTSMHANKRDSSGIFSDIVNYVYFILRIGGFIQYIKFMPNHLLKYQL